MVYKNAVVLITHKPNEINLRFFNSFTFYEIYVVIDDNSYSYDDIKQKYSNIHFIQLDNDICIQSGFVNASLIGDRNTCGHGWDKALYYLHSICNEFKFIWFLEDDIFFYDESSLKTIDIKYEKEDLLCNCQYNEEGEKNTWIWNLIKINYRLPYYCGMMCICRFTPKMLENINIYAKKNKTLFFLEALFPTIAKKNNVITIKSPEEFKSVTHRDVWNINDFNKNNLYHPVKDLNMHVDARKIINNNK